MSEHLSERSTRREVLVAGASAAAAATLVSVAPAAAANRHAKTSLTAARAAYESMRVERLLSVELLLLFSYQHVLGSSILPPRARRVLTPLRGHEEAHVHALTARLTALGGVAPEPPANAAAADKDLARRKVRGRLGQLRGVHDALGLLVAVERVVVGAYFVALIKLDDPTIVALIAQIMAADAQHEAIIGDLMYHGDAQKAVPYGLVQGVQ